MKNSTIFDNLKNFTRELWEGNELKTEIPAGLIEDQVYGASYSGAGGELLQYGRFVPWRVLGDPLQVTDVYEKLGFDVVPTASDYKTAELVTAGFYLSHFHNEYSLCVSKNYAINPALFDRSYKSLSITRSNIRGNIYWQAYFEGETNQLRESVRLYSESWNGDFAHWLGDIESEVMQTYAVRVSDLPEKFYK